MNSGVSAEELERLRQENLELRSRLSRKNDYIRNKINELLDVMGTKPLRTEELDDDMLLGMDPLGIIFNSIRHILTNLKETNAKLHLMHEETAAISEVADVGIMVVDCDYKIQSYNKKMKELFLEGKEAAEIIGDSCFHQLCHECSSPELCVCRNVLLSDGASRIMGKKLNGHIFDVAASPIKDTNGRTKEVVVVYHDITLLKATEETLKNVNADLEQRVSERTAQLTASNKELDAFAYSVSHDLRAPLRGMDGFSHALFEEYADKLDETGRDYINRIRKGCVRMGRLIDDLLKLSRITRSEINRITINLSRMADQVVQNLQKSEPGRVVELRIDSGMSAHADLTLIRSVLENLLGNAWKFTRYKADPVIQFSAIKNNDEYVYCIKDNGAGFNMEYADVLFAPFQRLHRPDEFEGTGIGLASAQRVISMHGGKIWAEGEEGKGAAFYFTLGDMET